MPRILRGHQPVPGGYIVRVEVTGAYTDGTSRYEEAFVPAAAVEGTRDQKLAAVRSALGDPFEDLRGRDVDTGEISRVEAGGRIGA
jgi:hypothetical protein